MGDYIHGEMIAYWLLKSKYFVRENIFLYWRFGGPANFVPEVRLMMVYMAQFGREMPRLAT